MTLSSVGAEVVFVAEADVDAFAAGGVDGIVGGLTDDGGDVVEGDAHLHGADLDFEGFAFEVCARPCRCVRWI